jgi:hypothetical protein
LATGLKKCRPISRDGRSSTSASPQRDGRGVGGHDRVPGQPCGSSANSFALGFAVLENRLDDDVGAGRAFALDIGDQAAFGPATAVGVFQACA